MQYSIFAHDREPSKAVQECLFWLKQGELVFIAGHVHKP